MNNAYIRAQQCKVKEAKFPFVKIGTQYWTTKNLSLSVTPQGNTIREMQANGNVEKITNIADREFSSDTGYWTKINSTINGGVVTINASSGIIEKAILSASKWYKLSVDVINYSGSGGLSSQTVSVVMPFITSIGTKVVYFFTNGSNPTTFRLYGQAGNIYDNISVQEIGWSNSQELYDGIYAQTSGTVEQKTYAAVKAAAMWCNYNNDAPTGLIYGKLYNWFAVKLFQMDIDYYNAANPTKKWASGFRIPTQTEFQTLSTYLGGDAVSGGKLKEAGLAHWSSPNLGADNSSGFSCLGSGRRTELGAFDNLSGYGYIQTISELSSTKNIFSYMSAIDAASTQGGNNFKARGYPIRLIKA